MPTKTSIVLYCFLFIVVGEVTAQQRYDAVDNYIQLPSDSKFALGQVSGLAIDQRDNLYVLHRAGRVWDLEAREALVPPVVLKFSSSGKLIGTFAEGVSALPHMIDVDNRGDVWIVDVSMQQLLRFSSEGKQTLQLGEAFVTGQDSLHFNLPTDVSVLKDGSFYVSDGYRNARVLNYSKDGAYRFQWGVKGTGDGEFNIPHSVKFFDNRVYVADRENSRLQVFKHDGTFISKLDVGEKIGRLFALTVGGNGDVYLSGMKEQGGGVLILGPDLKIKNELPTGGHDIAVDSKGNVYVAKGNNVVKFIPQSAKH